MARRNKTTEFLKDCIADAFLKLLEEKSPEKITATEITDLAGVGRATFFRNFTSKGDVITYRLVRLWDEWAAQRGYNDTGKFSLQSTEILFSFNLCHKDIIKTIYSAGMQSTIYDAFYRIMLPHFGTDSSSFYANSFYSYGCFGLLDEWVRRDFRETPAEMAEIVINGIVGKNYYLQS